MPFIQNVSWKAVEVGQHYDAGDNSMLIQIVDPCVTFPTPARAFKEVHRFEFLDLELEDTFASEFKVTDEQAGQLVKLLQHALEQDMNVIVHCMAGICRSGAVAEVGVMMGFEDSKVFRNPNLLVKHRMMGHLGWTYTDVADVVDEHRDGDI